MIHAGEGTSAAGFDGLARGSVATGIIERCPELFSQLGRFETADVDAEEVESTVRVALMAANRFRQRSGAVAAGGM